MKTYRKQELSRDDRGFFRYLGGKRFRLGQDERTAKIASAKLESLFARVGDWTDPIAPMIASAIARGEQQMTLAPNPEMVGAESYVHWVERYATAYADLIRIVPTHPTTYEQGRQEIMSARTEAIRRVEIAHPRPTTVSPASQRLHPAIDDYCEHVRQRKDTSGWIRVKVGQAERLKVHEDIPLSEMTLTKMDGMLTYWANRPPVKDRDKPISALTARNQMKELRDFWRWLNRADNYSWHRPDGWDELKPRIVRFPSDGRARTAVHVDTFTLAELVTLYRHATPLVRTFILLGLNCGFSIAEISTLSVDELHLHRCHPNANLLGITSTDTDSWIMRIRHKSGVYGEWRLWSHTARMMQWALNRRREIGTKGNTLLPTDNGTAFNAPTRTGNKSSRIPNLWNNLYRTAHKETPDLHKLPFKFLRKTAANMIRQQSDGEVSGVFLCHGKPVKEDGLSDAYSNRPFARLFTAIARVGELLQPLWDAVPDPTV